MSIILEALKKASGEENKKHPAQNGKIETATKHEESDSKHNDAVIGDNSPAQTKPRLAYIAIILIAGFSLLFFLGGIKTSSLKSAAISTGIKPVNLTSSSGIAPYAEGYTPPGIPSKQETIAVNLFNIKLPNPKLTLNGIVSGIGAPAAIIENKIFEEGMTINGTKILKIHDDKVDFLNESSGELFTLKVH